METDGVGAQARGQMPDTELWLLGILRSRDAIVMMVEASWFSGHQGRDLDMSKDLWGHCSYIR